MRSGKRRCRRLAEFNRASTGVLRAPSGADQTGVRLYNERLLLSLVRRFGQLSKIEVARMTGLSVNQPPRS